MAAAKPNSGTSDRADLPEKMCVICGIDVAQIARVKDETGRYMCRPCAVKQAQLSDKMAARERAPAPRARATDDPDAGIDLAAAASFEQSAQAAELPPEKSCPKCAGYIEEDQKLCLRCGYDRDRKVSVRTQVQAVREPSARSGRASGGGVDGLTGLGVGLGVLAIAAALLPLAGTAAGWAGFAVLVLLALGATLSTIVVQFKDGQTGWGVVSVLGFVVPFLAFATIYWALAKSGRRWLQYWQGLSFVGSIIFFSLSVAGFGPPIDVLVPGLPARP
jgi:predicted nucleic acid-binding Zn ribbon protein